MNQENDSISKSNTAKPESKAVVIKDPTHPEASPRSGVVPPVEHRFVKGDPRIRPGKRTAGATYANWLNELQEYEPADLLDLIKAGRTRGNQPPALKIAAARDILSRACPGDLADFEAVCNGKMSLEEARDRGLPTDWLKKVKVRTHTDKDGNVETTREIELKDDAHKSLDRVLDRTVGKPKQESEVNHNVSVGLGIVVRVEDGPRPVLPPAPGAESGVDGQ